MILEKEQKVYDVLKELDIPYIQTSHEPAATMEACLALEEQIQAKICKNLFLCNRQKTNFYLLLMPGDKPFKTKDISKQINSARLSFAGDEDLLELLNLTPGSCTIFGLLFDLSNKVQLIIDEDVLKEERFGCHPCINTSTIGFNTDDLLNKIIPYLNHDFIKVIL